jgi:hypothetical protein
MAARKALEKDPLGSPRIESSWPDFTLAGGLAALRVRQCRSLFSNTLI